MKTSASGWRGKIMNNQNDIGGEWFILSSNKKIAEKQSSESLDQQTNKTADSDGDGCLLCVVLFFFVLALWVAGVIISEL